MVFISCERLWFVDQHVLPEMSQLSNGVSELFIQPLLGGDVNGILSLNMVICSHCKMKQYPILPRVAVLIHEF